MTHGSGLDLEFHGTGRRSRRHARGDAMTRTRLLAAAVLLAAGLCSCISPQPTPKVAQRSAVKATPKPPPQTAPAPVATQPADVDGYITIRGCVRDAQGNPIPGARVTWRADR
jgi:hypothetical protein